MDFVRSMGGEGDRGTFYLKHDFIVFARNGSNSNEKRNRFVQIEQLFKLHMGVLTVSGESFIF